MKTYTAIGWLRGIIYFGVGGGLVAGGLFLTVMPGLPTPARIIGPLLVASATYGVWRLLSLPLAYGKEIAWYARVGSDGQMAVLPGDARDWMGQRRSELEGQVNRAWRWWATRHPDAADLIEDSLDGVHLAVLAQERPLADPRLQGHFRGMSDAGKIRLWYPAGPDAAAAYLMGFSVHRDVEEVFWSVLRHEVAHLCLGAMGVPDAHHHERMRVEGCPDA